MTDPHTFYCWGRYPVKAGLNFASLNGLLLIEVTARPLVWSRVSRNNDRGARSAVHHSVVSSCCQPPTLQRDIRDHDPAATLGVGSSHTDGMKTSQLAADSWWELEWETTIHWIHWIHWPFLPCPPMFHPGVGAQGFFSCWNNFPLPMLREGTGYLKVGGPSFHPKLVRMIPVVLEAWGWFVSVKTTVKTLSTVCPIVNIP